MITCPSCNHRNEIGSSFCENCGHDLRQMQPVKSGDPLPLPGGGPTCPNCGHENILGAAFCENCGNPLEKEISPKPQIESVEESLSSEDDQIRCLNCGHPNVPGSKYCENCGKELKKAPQVDQPQVEPPPEKVPESASKQEADLNEEVCTQCGFSNPVGTVFCGNCGMQLIEPPKHFSESIPAVEETPKEPEPSPQPEPPVPPIPKPNDLQGRFEVSQSGASIPIPTGTQEAIIGREDPVSGIFPEIDLDPHGGHEGGVGRRHVRLFIRDDQLMVEDQDSVNGTFLNRQKLNAFQPKPLYDGDELRLGKIVLSYHRS